MMHVAILFWLVFFCFFGYENVEKVNKLNYFCISQNCTQFVMQTGKYAFTTLTMLI